MTTVQIDLPDQLAQEARSAGLLSRVAMEKMLREAVRLRALNDLDNAMRRVAAAPESAMTPDEIQLEIRAARAERRVRETAAAGS